MDPARKFRAQPIIARDVFEKDKGLIFDLLYTIRPNDIEMFLQTNPRFRFPHKPFHLKFFEVENILIRLQHHGFLGFVIVTKVNDPHSTFPDAMDFISPHNFFAGLPARGGVFFWQDFMGGGCFLTFTLMKANSCCILVDHLQPSGLPNVPFPPIRCARLYSFNVSDLFVFLSIFFLFSLFSDIFEQMSRSIGPYLSDGNQYSPNSRFSSNPYSPKQANSPFSFHLFFSSASE